MAKTSLQKSHSKASNFKLTLICFLTILFFGALWCGLALLKGDLKTDEISYDKLFGLSDQNPAFHYK